MRDHFQHDGIRLTPARTLDKLLRAASIIRPPQESPLWSLRFAILLWSLL